jgi:hypothetical protein
MKVAKGFLLFAVSVLVTACFNPPEYSTTPLINFVNVSFIEGTADNPTDALTLSISFRDGDGDLGLSEDAIEEPYHDMFYGLANNGGITEVGKKTEVNGLPQFVHVPDGITGKLATTRTLQRPEYVDDLPPFINAQESCTDYKLQTVYILEKDKHIIDASYPGIDTLSTAAGIVYVVEDMFYFKRNPNHRNIEVEFWVNDGSGNYSLFDWEKTYCEAGFDQRFPMLSDKTGPLEGALQYALTSVGIKATFGTKVLRLKILIRDRALNISNEVQTDDFTL